MFSLLLAQVAPPEFNYTAGTQLLRWPSDPLFLHNIHPALERSIGKREPKTATALLFPSYLFSHRVLPGKVIFAMNTSGKTSQRKHQKAVAAPCRSSISTAAGSCSNTLNRSILYYPIPPRLHRCLPHLVFYYGISHYYHQGLFFLSLSKRQ